MDPISLPPRGARTSSFARARFLCLGLATVALNARCAEPPPGPTSEELAARALGLGQSPHLMGDEGQRLWHWAQTANDCDSLNMAAFLIVESSNQVGNSAATAQALALEGAFHCPVNSGALAYSFGANAALNGDWERAEFWFQRSVHLAKEDPPYFLQNALNALSVSHMNTGKPNLAIQTLETLHAMGDQHFPLEGFNSLAHANYLVGNCADALEWCGLGKDRVAAVVHAPGVNPVNIGGAENALLLTELEVCMAMGDTARARAAFTSIDFNRSFHQREVAAVALLTAYFQWIGNDQLASLFRPRLQALVAGASHGTMNDHLGLNTELYAAHTGMGDAAWREHLLLLGRTPHYLRGLPRMDCGPVPTGLETSKLKREERTWRRIAFALVGTAVAWGVAVFVHRRRELALAEQQRMSDREVLMQLDRMVPLTTKPTAAKRKLAARAFTDLMDKHFPAPHSSLQRLIQDWPLEEQDVAICLAKGLKTNEIAIHSGASMNRIYTTRRSIRRRLQLPSNVVLEDWLQTQHRS